jgi:hypothetical protein
MTASVIVRRIAQGIVVLCAAGVALVATRQDWPDVALIGLLGAGAVVTARKMAWQLRQGPFTGMGVRDASPLCGVGSSTSG